MKHAALAVAAVLAPGLALAQPTPSAAPMPDDSTSADAPVAEVTATTTVEAPAVDSAPMPPAADDKSVDVTYDKGLTFRSRDEAYELKLGLRSQFRWDVARKDVDDTEFQSKFLLPRLRLQLEGHAFGKAHPYKIEFDFANKGSAILKDAWVEHAVRKDLRVRAGQWKRPFNRQEIVSDFGSELVERSIMNEFVGGGRDLGVALHNNYEKSPDGLEWAIGVFNGTGEKAASTITCEPGATPADPPVCTSTTPTNVPSDIGPALVVHAGWNSGGIKGYSEGDLEGGPLRFAAAVSYRMNPHDLDEDAAGDLDIEHAVVADAMVKVSGLAASIAVGLVKDGQADAEVALYGQASYLLVPKKLLAAARFAQVPIGDESRHELLGGFDYFVHGHNLKIMADAGVLHTTGTGTSDLQVRTQLQLQL